MTTPFGTASSADQTFTTKPASGPLPTMFYGVPIPGRYVASLPATIEAKGQLTLYSVLIDNKGPINPGAPSMKGRPRIPATAVGGQGVVVQAVDLEPATTYHYRFLLRQISETANNEVLGPEGTFTTLPPLPPVTAVAKKRFKLRRGNVKLGRLTRRSKRLKARVHGLPAKTVVKVRLFVGGSKQTARKEGEQEGPGHLQTGAVQTHPQSASQEEGQALQGQGHSVPAGRTAEQRHADKRPAPLR